ncbi:MAG: MFS transporter [Actinobacteria bacterium]|nr:MFS transporter [Actinomycetota bacterium]
MPERSAPPVLVVFVGLMLGNALAALDTTMVATATPTIVDELHGLRDFSWITTAYLLGALAMMPIYGKLGDLYGRKRIFAVAMVTFLLGSALCGAAGTMTELIVFRGVQGLGAGGLVTLPMAMLADLVPARELGRWIGYSGFVFAFSSIAGPLVGGVFTEHASWRWAFLVNLPLGLISLAIVERLLHLPARRSPHRIDWWGAGLAVAAVACIVFLTSWGGSREPWGSTLIVLLGVGVIAFVIALVVRERRAPEPILPPRVFKFSVARVTLLMNLTVGLLFFAILYFVSAFLQFVTGISPGDAGLYLIPIMFGSVVGTMVVGRLVHNSGRYRLYPIVGTVIATAGVLLLLRLGADSGAWEALAAGGIFGFGTGLVMQVLILAIQNAVELRDIGVATSMSMFGRQGGGAVGLALLGSIFNDRLAVWFHRLVPSGLGLNVAELRGRPETLGNLSAGVKHDVATAFAHSLHTVFLACVPVAVISIVLALMLRENPLREHSIVDDIGDDLAVAYEGAAPLAAVVSDDSVLQRSAESPPTRLG